MLSGKRYQSCLNRAGAARVAMHAGVRVDRRLSAEKAEKAEKAESGAGTAEVQPAERGWTGGVVCTDARREKTDGEIHNERAALKPEAGLREDGEGRRRCG